MMPDEAAYVVISADGTTCRAVVRVCEAILSPNETAYLVISTDGTASCAIIHFTFIIPNETAYVVISTDSHTCCTVRHLSDTIPDETTYVVTSADNPARRAIRHGAGGTILVSDESAYVGISTNVYTSKLDIAYETITRISK
jgi:hypothetical protein